MSDFYYKDINVSKLIQQQILLVKKSKNKLAIKRNTKYGELIFCLFPDDENVKIEVFASENVQEDNTWLFSRRVFFDILSNSLEVQKRYKTKMAIMQIDINNLSLNNEIYGFEIGDKIIHSVGELLKQSLRDSDIVAHLGSDKYGIILEYLASNADVEVVCNRLIDLFKEPVLIESTLVDISISIGSIVASPERGLKESLILLEQAHLKSKEMNDNFIILI